MSTFYEDNMNIKKINGFTLQQVSRDVWAIDEFGIDIMYLIIGTERALLIDTGIGIGNIRSVVETMTHLPYDVVNTHRKPVQNTIMKQAWNLMHQLWVTLR